MSPSSAARAVALAVMGERRSRLPRSSREELPAAIRACSTTSRPPTTASVPSADAGCARRPPSGHPTAASAIRTASGRRPPSALISASNRRSTSQGLPFASRSSSRPSTTSAFASLSSARHGCAARPVAGSFAFGWPVSRTTMAGRTTRTWGPALGDQSTSTRCASRVTPSRDRLAAVTAAWPFHKERSSCLSRSVPPVAREPHRSRKTRAAVVPGGVWRNAKAKATSRSATRARPKRARSTRRKRERRRATGGAPADESPVSFSPPAGLTA